ncbi:response regulator [Larkinella soli]|uniref:response regulator n=1 Tax=Larkinella soli TaxID=1770527 RepID=UPI000FFBC89C|nr:response regulator [Larkinella soli]
MTYLRPIHNRIVAETGQASSPAGSDPLQEKQPSNDPTIIYLEADASYCWLYNADGTRTLTSRTLKYHQTRLTGVQFVRLNRTIIVNRQYIERVERFQEGYKIFLSTGASFFVSRRRWQVVRLQLADKLTEPADPQAEQIKILLVEDNPDQQLIMQYALQKQFSSWPYAVVTATEALNYLLDCQISQKPLPQMIILDLYLPKREDGWQLLRKLKTQSYLKDVPLIIMSYSRDPKDVEESYFWGASDYLFKPTFGEEWQDVFNGLSKYWECPEQAKGF